MFLMKFLYHLVVLLQVLLATQAYNYCQNASHLCDVSNMRHFVCHMDTELRPLFNKAKYVATVPDTLVLRSMILDYHNEFRDKLAGGDLVTDANETFPTASRMRELIWDEELAYLARLHASTVSFKHTICRSVLRFPHVGETLALVFSSAKRRSISELLDLMLLPMFDEYRVAVEPKDLIREFNIASHSNVGHFTLIGSDRLSRVGCGIVAATGCEKEPSDGYCHFLTCHYDFTNMAGSYIYKKGNPASQCCIWKASGKNTKYKNLCTNSGIIFPMDHGMTDEGQCVSEDD